MSLYSLYHYRCTAACCAGCGPSDRVQNRGQGSLSVHMEVSASQQLCLIYHQLLSNYKSKKCAGLEEAQTPPPQGQDLSTLDIPPCPLLQPALLLLLLLPLSAQQLLQMLLNVF